MKDTNIQEKEIWLNVVHPLNESPEQKVDLSNLGPMRMTRSVRWALIALRGYLIFMILLVIFKVVLLGGGIR